MTIDQVVFEISLKKFATNQFLSEKKKRYHVSNLYNIVIKFKDHHMKHILHCL